ncbi:hypothetical protein FBT96_12250 [Rhodobacter capsulatus]|uniref:Uncharacterized protein n=1 Tax=Rhodobacter capsulatus TaxID=1061 RepID=A0A4V5PTG7_RHOCA|nr:hypothetical protein FBT96_12250 [Rhodobacter capsulatus]
MTPYAACLLSTLFDPCGGGSFLIGLALGVGLARRGRWTLALVAVLSGAVIGAVFAAFHHNLNCVELHPG